MNETELRIGNFLFIPGVERVVKVSSIFITHFRCQSLDGISHDESIRVNYQPIPLTPEILDKIDWGGYIKLHFNSNFCIDDMCHLYYHNDYTGINIEYLHQLQNIYYHLTGKELMYTP